MDKSYLKKIIHNLPDRIKIILSPFLRSFLVKNAYFKETYELLIEREKLSDLVLRQKQFEDLKEILIYSNENVPYYQELFKNIGFNPYNFSHFDEIKVIPFLTREIIEQNFDKLVSTKKVTNGHYLVKTGGTTGRPLKIFSDYNFYFREYAMIYYYRSKLGYTSEDRLVTFRGIEFGKKFWKYNPTQNEWIFSTKMMSKNTIHSYVKRINQFKPQYLNGYLSAIWYFTKLLKENNIQLQVKLKGIFLISENINESQRKYVEDYFGVRAATHYGHSERCVSGQEIEPGKYRFNPYYGYTEMIYESENKYVIVGTGFMNRTMPLIRYKTDDLCIPDGDLFKIEGKRNSSVGLYGYYDEFLPISIFDLDDEVFNNVLNFQFIQSEKGKSDLLIVVNDKFQLAELEIMKKELLRQTRNIVDFNLKVVDHLHLSPSGKFQTYISNLNNV